MQPVFVSTFVSVLLLASGIAGFGVVPPARFGNRLQSSTTAMFAIRCEDKSYQLEEMEDKDSCTTELFLNEDRTVTISQTDGPPFDCALGTWEVEPETNSFTMVIQKDFGAGKDSTDMGEFSFQVSRTYVGEMTMVGESVGITGVMHTEGPGNDGDREVGFFNMIDGTDEKASYAQADNKLGKIERP